MAISMVKWHHECHCGDRQGGTDRGAEEVQGCAALDAGDSLMLMPSSNEAQLVIENGTPLIFPANRANQPMVTLVMVNELIAQGRLERERRFLGLDGDDSVADE